MADRSYISDVANSDLEQLVHLGAIAATTDASCLANADVTIICVPTPITKHPTLDRQCVAGVAQETGGLRGHTTARSPRLLGSREQA